VGRETLGHGTAAEFSEVPLGDHQDKWLIFYSRCNFSDGSEGRIHCIFISYPKREKRMWDDIVTRMSLSLRVRR
jgi:hypothetical protein